MIEYKLLQELSTHFKILNCFIYVYYSIIKYHIFYHVYIFSEFFLILLRVLINFHSINTFFQVSFDLYNIFIDSYGYITKYSYFLPDCTLHNVTHGIAEVAPKQLF